MLDVGQFGNVRVEITTSSITASSRSKQDIHDTNFVVGGQ